MASFLDRIFKRPPTPVSAKDRLVAEITDMARNSDKAEKYRWEQLALVIETGDGVFSTFGLLYDHEKITPFSVNDRQRPRSLRDAARHLQTVIEEETGHSFKKLLVQVNKATGRTKIEFEFDDPTRWSVRPTQLKAWREELRPEF